MRSALCHPRPRRARQDLGRAAAVWPASQHRGLAEIGADLPPDIKYDLPSDGDTLDEFVARAKLPTSAQIIAVGPGKAVEYELFTRSVPQEIAAAGKISEV